MNRAVEQMQMRVPFGAITRDLVEQVIEVSQFEQNQIRGVSPGKRESGMPSTQASPGRVGRVTVKSFINSLSPEEQAELASLMILGREPTSYTVQDIEATCDPTYWRSDVGEYLASKGSLAEFLRKGMQVIGL